MSVDKRCYLLAIISYVDKCPGPPAFETKQIASFVQ